VAQIKCPRRVPTADYDADVDLCEVCSLAQVDSIQRAEQAFELGADYGRVMGWYDEPDYGDDR